MLWGADVAEEWVARRTAKQGRRLGSCGSAAVAYNQGTLDACDFKAILEAAAFVDTEIAFKGSRCTDEERWESRRRLTMAQQALLCCFEAFIDRNAANQALMFDLMPQLQRLATPQPPPVDPGNGELPVPNRDPRTLVLAQAIVMGLLRGNEANCMQLSIGQEPHALFGLFAALTEAEAHGRGGGDASNCAELDFFFTMCMPEARPVREFQNYTAAILLDEDHPAIVRAVRGCVKAAGRPLSRPGPGPYRMVRLVRRTMLNGNLFAAAALSHGTGVHVGDLCAALSNYVTSLTVAGPGGGFGGAGALRSGAGERKDPREHNHRVLEALRPSKLDVGAARPESAGHEGGGFDLLQLLVEHVSLLPLNQAQLRSKDLWALFEMVLVPCFDALANPAPGSSRQPGGALAPRVSRRPARRPQARRRPAVS